MPPPRLMLPCAAVLAALLAGCSSGSSDKITARNQMDFDMWLSDEAQHLPDDEMRVIKEAEQEIKLQIMASGTHGSDAISDAFFAQVDGMTLNQFIQAGLDDRIKRLTADRDQAKELYSNNSKIQTRPGDTASAEYLQGRVNEDKSRLDRDEADLASTRADQQKYASAAASP